MTPLTASAALEGYFFEARSKILDLAAILDRIDRGVGKEEATTDPRVARLRRALEVLREDATARAEHVQQIFSLDYDPTWEKPKPRF